MITTGIKIYKNLVEAQVTDFQGGMETLFWEGTRDEFQQKYETQDSIIFPMHDLKARKCTRIMGFENAKSNDNSLQHKIATLGIDNQEQIKMQVKMYKKDFGKYPSSEWVNNVIDSILYPDKAREKEEEKVKEGEKIRNIKGRRIEFFTGLEKTQQDLIVKRAWDKVCEINPDYCDNHDSIYSKILFTTAKNEIIDNLLSDGKEGE